MTNTRFKSLRSKGTSLFLFLFCVVPATCVFAQQSQTKPAFIHSPGQYSPGGLLDNVHDLYGNKYTLAQISTDNRLRMAAGEAPSMTGESLIPGVEMTRGGTHPIMGTKLSTSCSPGYFRLYLEAGCGMDDSTNPDDVKRLAVMCQVLTDISNFIPSPCTTTGQKINIWVQNPGPGGGFLGEATPFFSMPYSTTASGIADNMIWITLNSGKDAWTNVVTPLYPSGSYSSFFHGSVAFQFDGTVNWHTDMTTAPLAGEYDLYTVALHEMMHALGFHTLINYDGNQVFHPGFKYFSRFDMQLQTPSGAHLITNTGSCSLYQYTFNTTLTPFATLSPGGTLSSCPLQYQTGPESNNTECALAVNYVDGSMKIPVYNPSCFERGSSLSHFEDECKVGVGCPLTPPASNDHYYVMSNAGKMGPYSATTNPGSMKRYPVPEERQALCDLGYQVNTTFGKASNLNLKTYTGGVCPGLQVAGINDGIASGVYTYASIGGAAVTITEASLIANDFGAAHASCLEVVNGTGTISGGGSSYTYTPGAGEYGLVLLRYLPVSASSAVGNITYVYVFVGSSSCIPSACDMMLNGGFEDVDPISCGDIASYPGIIHCWDVYVSSPDLYSTACLPGSGLNIPYTETFYPTGPHMYSKVPNNHFVDMQASNNNGGPDWCEGMQSALSTPLIHGENYILSFWAKTARLAPHFGPSFPFMDNHMEFATTPSVAPLAYAGDRLHSFPTGLDLIWDVILPTEYGDDWLYFEKHFTFAGDTGSRLVVFNAPYFIHDTSTYYLINFIDDISIKLEGTACLFAPPSICATSTTPIDLTGTVNIPGGTFSWPTIPVTTGNVPTISHSNMFDPVGAYAASIADTSKGIIPIAYTYTDILGCTQTVYANIYIYTSTIPPITGVMTTPVGAVTALSDSVSGGSWISSNTAIATVGSASGGVMGVATGTVTITYLMGTDCRATTTVTVTAGAIVSHTGVSQATANLASLSVFPNPNKGVFTIAGTIQNTRNSKELKIELVDMLGKTILKDVAAIENGGINKKIVIEDQIPNGIYLIKVKTDHASQVIRFTLDR